MLAIKLLKLIIYATASANILIRRPNLIHINVKYHCVLIMDSAKFQLHVDFHFNQDFCMIPSARTRFAILLPIFDPRKSKDNTIPFTKMHIICVCTRSPRAPFIAEEICLIFFYREE